MIKRRLRNINSETPIRNDISTESTPEHDCTLAILTSVMDFMGANSMLDGRKIILGLLALVMVIGCAVLACGLIGYGLHSAHAQQQYTVTTKDFYIPSGEDPWGTTFDSKGNVWLAIPGCDPAPTCDSVLFCCLCPCCVRYVHKLSSLYDSSFVLSDKLLDQNNWLCINCRPGTGGGTPCFAA
jgi:hypothetical protein